MKLKGVAAAAASAKSLQLCPTLCDPIDGSPPGSAVPGILQARTLEWVAISFSNAWKWKSESEVAQSCLTVHDSMDCSPPGSSVPGILQARVLEWGAISFSIEILIIFNMYMKISNSGPKVRSMKSLLIHSLTDLVSILLSARDGNMN